MKKIIILGMVLMTMVVSLGGCFWYPDDDRGGRHDHDRGDRHDRGERHDSDGGERYERR